MKLFLYATASGGEGGVAFTHAITWRPNLDQQTDAIMGRRGPSGIFQEFLNRQLEPVYRRNEHHLEYIYQVEIESPFTAGEGKNRTIGAERWHGTIAINIPDEEMLKRVENKLAFGRQRAGSSDPADVAFARGELTGNRTGYHVHLTEISADKSWTSGDYATGRSALLGLFDYAGKDTPRLRWTHEVFVAHDARIYRKICGASASVREAARAWYEDLKAWIEMPIASDHLATIFPAGQLPKSAGAFEELPRRTDEPALRSIFAQYHFVLALHEVLTDRDAGALGRRPWKRYKKMLRDAAEEAETRGAKLAATTKHSTGRALYRGIVTKLMLPAAA